ncbi:MAG: hypothetical protein AB1454_13735 [Candidatus Auribacterota bacterium]
MKRLISLSVIALLASMVTAASAQVAIYDNDSFSQASADVEINITFAPGTDPWTIEVQDNEGNPITEFDNTSISTLHACGDDKKVVAKGRIVVDPQGAWEVVTYTDNFTTYFNSLTSVKQVALMATIAAKASNKERSDYIGTYSGLKQDLTDTFTHYLPIKIRSEAVFGKVEARPYDLNDIIDPIINDPVNGTVNIWTGDSAEFGYIPELHGEDYVAGSLKVLAQIGHPTTDPIVFAIAVDEATAGSGMYEGVVYFDLRGN